MQKIQPPILSIDDTDPENPIITYESGYFVIHHETLPDLDEYLYTKGGHTVISGAPTFCYRFDSEELAEQLLERFSEETISLHARAKKRASQRITEIRAEAATFLNANVIDENGISWRGGSDSGSKIKSAIDLHQFAGLSEISLRDAHRVAHNMSLNDALKIAALIGIEYQRRFQIKEDAMSALESMDCWQPDALMQIEAISLE